MSSQYKENNFSTEKFKVYESTALNEKMRPNIDFLINRILIKRKQEKRNVLVLGYAISITLISIFFIF